MSLKVNTFNVTDWSRGTKIGLGVAAGLVFTASIVGIVAGGVGAFGKEYTFTGSASWLPITSSVVAGGLLAFGLLSVKNWCDWKKVFEEDLVTIRQKGMDLAKMNKGDCFYLQFERVRRSGMKITTYSYTYKITKEDSGVAITVTDRPLGHGIVEKIRIEELEKARPTKSKKALEAQAIAEEIARVDPVLNAYRDEV